MALTTRTTVGMERAKKQAEYFQGTQTGKTVEKAAEVIVNTTGTVVEAAGTVVGGTFDVIVWIKENWQLAIVGVVALLVLLKD